MCCAGEKLFISYPAVLADGSKGEPSAFLTGLINAFKIETLSEPAALKAANLPETPEGAFSEFCRRYTAKNGEALEIYAAFDGEYRKKCEHTAEFSARPQFSLSPDTAAALYGKDIRMSPSKFDDFNRCRFMHFCRDGLKIRSLQSADFNVMQRGTLVHYVLQRVVETYGKGLAELTAEDINAAVDRFVKEYLDNIPGYRTTETPRLKYIANGMARNLKSVVYDMSRDFANSDFTPVACELKVGAEGAIPEVCVSTENGGTVRLSGIIDRLDKYEGYVRVVDYKTGSRNFKLPDILFGQNMQMLIYLYAVCKAAQGESAPAGILYMPALHKNGDAASKHRMNGLLLEDEHVLKAMDIMQTGEFVPKPTGRTAENFISDSDFLKIFALIERKLKSAGERIYEGKIAANPTDGIDSGACKYCEFKGICRIDEKEIKKVPNMPAEEVFEKMGEVSENEV